MGKEPRKRALYGSERLLDALTSIANGEKVAACARRTGIPYSTLRDKLAKKENGLYLCLVFPLEIR